MRVVIIGNHKFYVEQIKSVLQQKQINEVCVISNTISTELSIAADFNPELIIVNTMIALEDMPSVFEINRRAPVLYLTPTIDDEFNNKLRDMGVDEIIEKPPRTQVLIAYLEQVFQRIENSETREISFQIVENSSATYEEEVEETKDEKKSIVTEKGNLEIVSNMPFTVNLSDDEEDDSKGNDEGDDEGNDNNDYNKSLSQQEDFEVEKEEQLITEEPSIVFVLNDHPIYEERETDKETEEIQKFTTSSVADDGDIYKDNTESSEIKSPIIKIPKDLIRSRSHYPRALDDDAPINHIQKENPKTDIKKDGFLARLANKILKL